MKTMSKLYSPASRSHRLRDFAVYMSISLLVVASLVAAALNGISTLRIMNTYGFLLFTAAVFAQFILLNKILWQRTSFWLLCLSSFMIHVALCVWLLRTKGEISGKQWLAFSLVEIVSLVGIRRFMFGAKASRPK